MVPAVVCFQLFRAHYSRMFLRGWWSPSGERARPSSCPAHMLNSKWHCSQAWFIYSGSNYECPCPEGNVFPKGGRLAERLLNSGRKRWIPVLLVGKTFTWVFQVTVGYGGILPGHKESHWMDPNCFFWTRALKFLLHFRVPFERSYAGNDSCQRKKTSLKCPKRACNT